MKINGLDEFASLARGLRNKPQEFFPKMLVQRPSTPGQEDELVRAILDYLKHHPHAADSAQGVACWWLGERGAQVPLPRVQAALSELVARQTLRQEMLADGTSLYSGNAVPMPGEPDR